MKDGRFEVGDLIKGINERRYLITNKNMTRGEVISLYKEKSINKMRIMIKETTNGKNCDSKTYGVENSTMYFELIKETEKERDFWKDLEVL